MHPAGAGQQDAVGGELEHPVVPRRLQLYDAQPGQGVEHRHRRAAAGVVGHHEVGVVARRWPVARPDRQLHAVDRTDRVDEHLAGEQGDGHETSRGSRVDRSARSPLARTRPDASASGQESSPVASAIQVSASSSTTAGGVPARVAHARDRLHGGVRRHPDLHRRTRRTLGQQRQVVLDQQPRLLPIARRRRERGAHLGGGRGPETSRHGTISPRAGHCVGGWPEIGVELQDLHEHVRLALGIAAPGPRVPAVGRPRRARSANCLASSSVSRSAPWLR